MEIKVHHGDQPAIEVIYYDVTPGNHESWTVPIGAVAAHAELLGYADPVEALKAVVHILKHGMPPADPDTGRDVLADSFALLTHRETRREDEAVKAAAEGADVLSRASGAAYDAVHKPINGGDCAMDRCRRATRRALGLPEPSRVPGEEARQVEPEVKAQPMRASAFAISTTQPEEDELTEKVATAIKPFTGDIARATRVFLHDLAGGGPDPLEDVAPLITTPPGRSSAAETILGEPTADQLLAKYQEGQP